MIEVRRYEKLAGPEAPALWVLHGGPGAPGSVASLARAFAPRFRVYEPIQRRADPDGPPLDVARHVADLADVTEGRFLLLGWSWGAMLALSFAFAHPERVQAISLVGCGTYDETSRAEYKRLMRARVEASGRSDDELKAWVEASPTPEERNRRLAERGAILDRAQAVDPIDPPDSTGVERYPELEVDALGNRQTWNDVLRLQRESVEPNAFAAIKAPVRLDQGADDPHPGERIRDSLLPHLPHLEYVSYPACGHEPWLERQAREPFLEGLGAWLLQHAEARS